MHLCSLNSQEREVSVDKLVKETVDAKLILKLLMHLHLQYLKCQFLGKEFKHLKEYQKAK